MRASLKGFILGIPSGLLTYFVSTFAIAHTAAFAMPVGFPMALWDALVIFGLGAWLFAFFVHFAVLRLFLAKALPSLFGFALTTVAALAATDLLSTGYKALLAWLLGAAVASLAAQRLRPNNSFKPNPLRGSA